MGNHNFPTKPGWVHSLHGWLIEVKSTEVTTFEDEENLVLWGEQWGLLNSLWKQCSMLDDSYESGMSLSGLWNVVLLIQYLHETYVEMLNDLFHKKSHIILPRFS